MILDKLVQIWPQPLYKVGGCVRDELLGLPIKDVDLCSSLLPSEVLSLCQTNNIKCEVINADHLVVLIDKQWEHTTFRTERNCDGVHAEVAASSNLEEDAFRRDLSVNAIYRCVQSGELIDPVGGIADIHNKRLRLISSVKYGNQLERLFEHGGRLFRLARFSAIFTDWQIEPATLAACVEFSDKVFEYHSVEAFNAEWEKCDHCFEYLQFLDTVGFLSHHNLSLPHLFKDHDKAWFYLWRSAGYPNMKVFKLRWKLTRRTVDICLDLQKGELLSDDWEWVTAKFKVLSAEEVATFWNKSFIRLSIPTQGDIANQIGSGPDVVSVWKDTVQRIYLDQQH